MATVWRWTVKGTDASGLQEWNSTMHYQTDLVPLATEPNATDVLNALTNHYGSTPTGMERWLVTVQTGVKLTGTSVYEELAATDTSVPQAAHLDFNYNGSVAVLDAGTPFAMCPWIKFGTGLASRSARGGTHLSPSIDQNHLTAVGLWDTTLSWWAAIVALAGYMDDSLHDDIILGGTGHSLNPVVYSRTRRNLTLTPYTFHPITATPSPIPRWLRRRDVGR